MNRAYRFVLSSLVFLALPLSAQHDPDGTIVENVPCAANTNGPYDAYLQTYGKMLDEEVEAARHEGFTMTKPANLAAALPSRQEYERRRRYEGFECRHIKYLSDGLKVSGLIWKPKKTGGAPRPLVIYNRGGNRDFGAVNPWFWSGFYAFLDKGFVVLASQYRGNDGGEGHEEFGGADVRDILNLVPLARSLGYVDMNNVFMFGASRGGMMTYLALKQGMNVNAVAVMGGLTDVVASAKERPELALHVYKELIPDYDKGDAPLRERSAVEWADKINVPVLILQGGADWRADPSQALTFAQKLQERHKTYELIIYAGDSHGLVVNRLESEKRIIDWFKRYLRTTP